jgi:hypothetical protein
MIKITLKLMPNLLSNHLSAHRNLITGYLARRIRDRKANPARQ